jgi:Protein of unknown function (DUF2800)
MGDPAGHALVAPSGLPLTKECAASLLLQFMAPPLPDTDEEAEGTAAHHHAVQWAMGRQMPRGTKFMNGGREWEVDMDMENGSRLFAYHCVKGFRGRYEDPVGMPTIHAQCHGTPDYWAAYDEARMALDVATEVRRVIEVHVKDYKYGHRYVDPFENWQLLSYAIGVCIRLGLTDPEVVIVLVIVQPRAYHRDGPVKEWRITLGDLFRWGDRIREQVELALAPNAPARVGNWCLDCKARHICNTLQTSAMAVAEFAGIGEAVDMPTDSIAVEARIMHDAMAILRARYEGLIAQLDALARRGQQIPGWMLEDGRSSLKWNAGVSVDTLRDLGAALGLDLLKAPAPITPTQAKDLGLAEAVVDKYATRGPAGKTLKPITTTAARKLFGANRP